VWNELGSAWVTVATNSEPTTAPAALSATLGSTSAPLSTLDALNGGTTLRVRVLPVQENGPEPNRATVALDDLFIDVKTQR
jgi:hypothetical protein